jgi:hypothetical protein
MSNCRGLVESECITNSRCLWTNGTTRKYCKNKPSKKSEFKYILQSSQIKNPKSHSKTIRENPKLSQEIALVENPKSHSKTIRESPKLTQEIALVESPKLTQEIALVESPKSHSKTIRKSPGKVIHRFMMKDIIIKRSLMTVCNDTGECMALGKGLNMIRKYFNGFTDFKYVDTISRVGTGANGFITKLNYKKYNYICYAILKSSQTFSTDNLVYEYAVGQFINKQCMIFPCFLETYGLYYYKDESKWEDFKDFTKTYSKHSLNSALTLQSKPINYSKACRESKYVSILIQDIKNPISLFDLINIYSFNITFTNNTLLYLLIQVYYPLAMLSDNFTHYDLHSGNVLIYELPSNKHMEYELTDFDNNTFSFNTNYIVKIIDYGRSYFHESYTNNSLHIYNSLCSIPECNQTFLKCGQSYGFNFFIDNETTKQTVNRMIELYENSLGRNLTIDEKDKKYKEFFGEILGDNYFIDTNRRNMSHDLRLVDGIIHSYEENNITHKIIKRKTYCYNRMTSSVKQLFNSIKYDTMYGTPESTGDRDNPDNPIIESVVGLYRRLLSTVRSGKFVSLNIDKFRHSTKIGKLKVDGKNPVKIIST